MKSFDVIIIGGGIVGLATAKKILDKKPDLKIALLEKEHEVAMHQTGNNSGVIHSGLYYKPGSLKATNCINGYKELIDFCTKHDIKFELCGKIVVATNNAELSQLETLYKRGAQNGLTNIKKINGTEIKDYEPYATGIAALHVPQTGIVDYKSVSLKLAELIRSKNASIELNTKVLAIKKSFSNIVIETTKGDYEAKFVINCAGLYSDKVAEMTESGLDSKIIPFRGEYYELKKEKQYLVKNLIYPVPDPNFPFLGVHYTRMINGGVEAGPNAVFAFKKEGYKKSDFDFKDVMDTLTWPGFRKVAAKYWKTGIGEYYRSYSKAAFTKALQKLIPEIQEHDLIPGGSGVRAQACDRNGALLDDFKIIESDKIIHVINAPSPAATSSLSIGNTISELAVLNYFNTK